MDIIKMTCLVDSSRGIYQGQELAENYPELINDEESLKILLSGPDTPEYDETLQYVVDSYSYDRDFLIYGEGDPDIMLCSPDDEAQGIIMDFADAGNKVAIELLQCQEWKTREDIIWEYKDAGYNTPEVQEECDAIREALECIML